MKKKVMLLITGLYYGGMERVAFIAHSLLKDKYDVTIVTLYANDSDYEPDFEYIDLNCPPKSNKILKILNIAKRSKEVKRVKKQLKPDIVMSFGTSANFSNMASKGTEKVVVGIRSYDWLTEYFATYSVDKWTYTQADKVVSVSKVIAKKAEKVFNIDPSKNTVLYNPYDVELIGRKAKEEITEIELLNNNKVIISVGRLVNQKGFNHLIKAFSLVVREFPEAKLLIAGHGNKEGELRNLITQLGINDNVILLGGQSNPYKFMKLANLYVLSSITEGFPNAMVEAMSVGLPILAADCKSGPREILSLSDLDKETDEIDYCEYGVITKEMSKSYDYDARNIEKCDYILADGIKLFLENTELMNRYSNKALERAQEFTYEKFESKLVQILESL